MSINLRIYADQIFGFSQSYLKEYISPEIVREEFINNFKSGKLNYENISTKKIIKIHPHMNLNELSIQNFEIKIPNETENLSLLIGKLNVIVELQEIEDDEIEKIILSERKNLIDGFINYVIKKIEKKDESKTFIEGLIETFVNRAINGLLIDLNNIELLLKYKNNIFCLNIGKITYSEEKGIKMNDFSISLVEEGYKKDILKKFSLSIELTLKKEKKDEDNLIKNEGNNLENNIKEEIEENKNKLNINITNIEFDLNQNTIYALNDIYDLFNKTDYKKIFIRYKKLIQYHKPKIDEDKKNYYLSLWYYAIKTVIKLQKYIGRKKQNIFSLIESSQKKLVKKYIDDNNKINNLLLPEEINLLKFTKEKVEKQLLENKKGGGISKAFSFFFGGGGDDEKKELTEEEKNELNQIYSDEYLIKYLLGLNEGQKSGNNPLSEKINKIINELVINIHIDKIEVKENNYNCNFFIKKIIINSNLINKKFDFEVNIEDIGTLLNESLFSDKFKDTNYLIQIKTNLNSDKIKLNLGFNNIILNEDMFIFILTYFYKLKINSKIMKLFHKTDYNQFIITEQKQNTEEKNNIEIDEHKDDSIKISDNISISNIPSLTLLNNDKNKLELNITNFYLNENNIILSLNVQDSFGIILDNYSFNFNIEKEGSKQKYKLHLEQPMNIIISKETSFFIFLTYLKLKEFSYQRTEINDNNNSIKDDIYTLYCFNYVEHKDVNIDFNYYCFDFLINNVNFELNERKCSSFFLLKKLSLKYENKNLILNIEKIEGNVDYLSDIILYILDFKSKDFDQYEKLIFKNIKKKEEVMKNKNTNIKNNASQITTSYNIKMNDILSNLNLEIGIITFGIKIEENTIYANIYVITGKNDSNELNIITISTNNINLYIEKKKINEKYNILNLNKQTLIDYNLTTELFKVKLDSPILSIFIPIFSCILNDLDYLLNQIDWTVIICKIQMEIFNSSCKINVFHILINYIYISNFDGKTTDSFFLKTKDLIIRNEKNANILEQEELDIKYSMKSKIEDFLGIKLNQLKTNISKNDIKNYHYLLDSNKKSEDKMNLKGSNIDENRKNEILEQKEFCLVVEGNIKNINLGFCLDDYTKKVDFNLNQINISLKKGTMKIEGNNTLQAIFDYKIIFDKINLKYYDENKKEIIVLNYLREIKKTIKANINQEIINQVEIISQNNNISMNFNRNNINLRLDCFLYLYNFFDTLLPSSKKSIKNNDHFFFNDILDIQDENEKSFIDNLNIQINLNKTKFHIQTSFDSSENLYINFDNFIFSINSLKDINIKLDSISSSFISQKQKRELFHTKNDFLLIKCTLTNKKILDMDSHLNTIVINLSYQDLISFFRCYLINKILLQKIDSIIKNQPKQNLKTNINDNLKQRNSMLNSVITIIDSQKKSFIRLKLHLKNLFFTLVDNSSLNYQPFLNGSLINMELNYNQINTLEFSYKFLLSSYNYISCIWEPILEDIFIKTKYDFSFDKKESENNIIIDIDEINMNLSDMAISLILNILQNWNKKFIEDQKNYSNIKVINSNKTGIKIKLNSNSEDKNNEIKTKMSNTSIINNTGMDLKIKYNKVEYKLAIDSKIDLEYIPDWNADVFGPKQILLLFDNNKVFKILFEKLDKYEFHLEQNYTLIAENTLSKDRHINITIYSPIIIKNKTSENIQIKLENSKVGNYFYLLKPNSIMGINYSYYNQNTTFSLNLIDKNKNKLDNKFHLKDMIESDEFSHNFLIGGKFFYIKLIRKLNNLKEILITFQYCIVNGLPCELIMENQKEKKPITIKKFTQYFLDFYCDLDSEFVFKIKIGEEYYYSNKNKYLKEEGKDNYFSIFRNKDKTKSFKLSIQYKTSKNTRFLIIYTESFLYNYSGIDFDINSQNEGNPLLFKLENKLYLISTKIDNIKNAWIQLKNNKYISNRIILDDIIQANPYYKFKLTNDENILNLSIKKEISNIAIRNNPNFKYNITIMTYKIYPFCRIINLLTSKNILIAEENNKRNCIIINTLKEISFNFFEKGKNTSLLIGLLNIDNNKCSPLIKFKLSSFGIYSFCLENTLFNVEIKESKISGLIDIFFVESNLENAKIIVENRTNSNFIITQEGYEQFWQILPENEKQILKIYDNNCNYFIIKDNHSNKSYRFSFNSFRKEEYQNEINNLIFIKESNGMKMKLTIMNKENFNQIKSATMNIGLKLKIGKVFISVIGDNEYKDKKLRNYERYELSLIQLNNAIIVFNLNHHSGLLDNDKYNFKFNILKMNVYNQVSKYGKYSNVFNNTSFSMIDIETEIIDYKNSFMSKINHFKLDMGKLKLSIDPNFIQEIINFQENLFYRMEISNFNVDELFLHQNRDNKIKKQFENYKKENSIYYGTNFSFPIIDINFELNEVGLDELLKDKLNAPQIIIWIGNGLVGNEQNINIKPLKINNHFGSLKSLIEKIILIYKDAAESEVTKIAFRGILGQIGQWFSLSKKTSKYCIDVKKGRIRHPRAFFGEYKYFKKYDQNDEKCLKILDAKFDLENSGIYISEFILGEKYLFTFTKYFLIILENNFRSDFSNKSINVDYDNIDKAISDKSYVTVYLNIKGKNGKNSDHISFDCENEYNANNICKLLNAKSKNILV